MYKTIQHKKNRYRTYHTMPYKRESKARRRKTKLKQGLINTTTEFHNQSPNELSKNSKRKPRDSGSWFVNYMKSTKRKQLYGHRGGRKRGGKDSNFEGYKKKDKNNNKFDKNKKKMKNIPKDAFDMDNNNSSSSSIKNKEMQSQFKRQKGESSRDYKVRMRKENAKAILEEKKKNTNTNSKLKRKRYLEEQKIRKKMNKKRKQQRNNNSSDDEDNIYEKVKFGERVEDIPNLNTQHRFQGGGKRKVVTLLNSNAMSSADGLDIGDRKSYSQMDELAKQVHSSYFARQLS